MKIGVFDSGLGGLIILNSLLKKLPQYDYVYLGDTKRVPYGSKSQELIYEYTKQSVEYLFKNNCKLVILACNTASSKALRKLQREFLPKYYPDRKILGVIIPTVEVASNKNSTRVGILATQATVDSKVFVKEFQKFRKGIKVFQEAAPLLVPMIEHDGVKWLEPVLQSYLKNLLKQKVQTIVLGCTHYSLLKTLIRKIVGKNVEVISQDEIIAEKLKLYLNKHIEIESSLSKKSKIDLLVTDLTSYYKDMAKKLLGRTSKIKIVNLE